MFRFTAPKIERICTKDPSIHPKDPWRRTSRERRRRKRGGECFKQTSTLIPLPVADGKMRTRRVLHFQAQSSCVKTTGYRNHRVCWESAWPLPPDTNPPSSSSPASLRHRNLHLPTALWRESVPCLRYYSERRRSLFKRKSTPRIFGDIWYHIIANDINSGFRCFHQMIVEARCVDKVFTVIMLTSNTLRHRKVKEIYVTTFCCNAPSLTITERLNISCS